MIPDPQTANREASGQAEGPPPSAGFVHRALVAIGVATASILLVLLVVYASQIFMLIFAGILLAILLRGVSDWLSAHTFLTPGWALGVTVVVLLGLLAGLGWTMGNQIAQQVHTFARELPRATQKAEAYLKERGIDEYVRNAFEDLWKALSDPGLLTSGTGALRLSLHAVTDLFIVLFLGFFFAAEPQPYVNGILHLFPQGKRQRIREVLEAVRSTLSWWLVGRFVVMAVVGILAGGGLHLLGVPLPWMLAAISAVLSFIPNVGLVVAALLAALFAVMSGPTAVLYVLLLYVGIGGLEGWVLTPLIQQRTLAMPGGMILATQVLLGFLLGFLGVFLATPLTAMLFVIVKRLYVQDTLGDHSVT